MPEWVHKNHKCWLTRTFNQRQVTHLPLWGTDAIKGIMQIEAGSTILAGIAAANVFVHCLEKERSVYELMTLVVPAIKGRSQCRCGCRISFYSLSVGCPPLPINCSNPSANRFFYENQRGACYYQLCSDSLTLYMLSTRDGMRCGGRRFSLYSLEKYCSSEKHGSVDKSKVFRFENNNGHSDCTKGKKMEISHSLACYSYL